LPDRQDFPFDDGELTNARQNIDRVLNGFYDGRICPDSTPGLSRRRFRSRKFRRTGLVSDVARRKRFAELKKFALYRSRRGFEIYEDGLPAIAIRIVAVAAQGHSPPDQRRKRRPVIVRIARDHFNAGEADVTAVFETKRPPINDGAHHA
jgi:hypothetical protein